MALRLAGPFPIPVYESQSEPSPRARQLRARLIALLEAKLANPALTLQDVLDALHTTLWFADDRDGDAA